MDPTKRNAPGGTGASQKHRRKRETPANYTADMLAGWYLLAGQAEAERKRLGIRPKQPRRGRGRRR